jgi:hypothetical protein
MQVGLNYGWLDWIRENTQSHMDKVAKEPQVTKFSQPYQTVTKRQEESQPKISIQQAPSQASKKTLYRRHPDLAFSGRIQ